MSSKHGDFSRGSVSSNIIRLALPMIAAEFVHVLYNIVDRMYLGRIPSGGTLALSGIGISFPLVTLIGAFALVFAAEMLLPSSINCSFPQEESASAAAARAAMA